MLKTKAIIIGLILECVAMLMMAFGLIMQLIEPESRFEFGMWVYSFIVICISAVFYLIAFIKLINDKNNLKTISDFLFEAYFLFYISNILCALPNSKHAIIGYFVAILFIPLCVVICFRKNHITCVKSKKYRLILVIISAVINVILLLLYIIPIRFIDYRERELSNFLLDKLGYIYLASLVAYSILLFVSLLFKKSNVYTTNRVKEKKMKEYLKYCVYQIYPKSFCDNNGDGIGDLQGIISKLDYLKDLGINAIWLSPIYSSPQDDNGYDISNYYEIDPMYGTMSDFDELVSEMHKRDMKLIMDYVANHTSTAHMWFKESRKKHQSDYRDYYYWRDQPTDISSIFGGSAWEYDSERGQYYLHSFAKTQADLNWENFNVRIDMKNVLKFWKKKGVDGFRCDVIDLISKDLNHNKIGNGPRLHSFIHELFSDLNVFTVGECGSRDIKEIEEKIDLRRNELTTLFQFDHIDVTRPSKFIKGNPKLYEYRDVLSRWCQLFQDNKLIYTLFTDNHDQSYMISRLGDSDYYYESATCIAAMTYLLKGIPFIYQGIEFGSINSHYEKIEDFDDIESINYYNERIKEVPIDQAIEEINFGGRDNPRRPMAWSDSKNGGFSDGTPWIKLSTNIKEINLKHDQEKDKSIYKFYKAMLNLRNTNDAFTSGYYLDRSYDNTKFIFERIDKTNRFIVICNFEEQSNNIDLQKYGINDYEIVLSNYKRTKLEETLLPYEVNVIRIKEVKK